MQYKIIQDLALLEEFVSFLPDLAKNETYYVSLLARNKYFPALKADKAQLKRFTSDKKMLIQKIRQLECGVGDYVQENLPIPQEALALYINPNPRDMEAATKQGLIRFANLITHPYNGYNPHQEILSEIQKSCSRKFVIDFDFDKVDMDSTVRNVLTHINREAVHILQTRGGFHILVEPKKIAPEHIRHWHQHISKQEGCDVVGDNLIPVVGCTQGGFVPHFVK